jgi:flagellar hook-length control protein FliK
MNQLATMLDTDLTVDRRARSARSADDAESGVDFGQVLQGLSMPEDASVNAAGFGHVRRHAKKSVGDGLAITSFEGAKAAPLTPIDIDSAAVSLGSTEIAVSAPNGSPNASMTPATNGASAAAGTAGSAGQAARVGLSRSDVTRGEDTGRAMPAADAAKVVKPGLVEGAESGGRLAGKSVAGGAGASGAGMALNAASAAIAASAAKGSGSGDSTRLATGQPKPSTSLETKALEARSPTLPLTESGAWALGALAHDESTSALREPVAAEATMTASMGSEEWQMDLGTQLVAMIEKGDQSAVINLSPVELGPVQIDVAVHEGEVSVAFAAQAADTRAAIEASLPKLRELLAGEGLSLTNSNINDILSGFSQQKSSSRGNEDRPAQRGRFAEPESAVLIQSAPNRVRRSLVDLYA